MSWREVARPIIKDVLRRTAGQPEKVIQKALHDAYPFRAREYYPYHVWLDEIQVQRKTKKVKLKDRKGRIIVIDPKQERLL